MIVPIEKQVECVKRELGYRERVYPRRVADGKMTEALAKYQLEAMHAVLETLNRIAETERLI